MKRLKDVRTPLANFFASGVFNLRHKLGPILWQFPRQMRLNLERFAEFFELLPRAGVVKEILEEERSAVGGQ